MGIADRDSMKERRHDRATARSRERGHGLPFSFRRSTPRLLKERRSTVWAAVRPVVWLLSGVLLGVYLSTTFDLRSDRWFVIW